VEYLATPQDVIEAASLLAQEEIRAHEQAMQQAKARR
jgi:hypothetical protein